MQPPIRSPLDELGLNLTRRRFFAAGSHPIGAAALSALLADEARPATAGAIGPHFAPRAKHVIYLHMVGGPPQQDMFDYKPMMNDWYDKDLPASIRNGQRLTTMTSGQKRVCVAPSAMRVWAVLWAPLAVRLDARQKNSLLPRRPRRLRSRD